MGELEKPQAEAGIEGREARIEDGKPQVDNKPQAEARIEDDKTPSKYLNEEDNLIEKQKENTESSSKDYSKDSSKDYSKDYKDFKDNRPFSFQPNIKEPFLADQHQPSIETNPHSNKNQDFSLGKRLYEIIQQADLTVASEKIEMNITLKPEFLGKLNMKLSMNEGILEVKFTVGNSYLKELIEANLHNLRETFSQLETGIGNIEVSIENGFLAQRDLWNKMYNESQSTNHIQLFKPEDSFKFYPDDDKDDKDDKLARLYWTQAQFEFVG